MKAALPLFLAVTMPLHVSAQPLDRENEDSTLTILEIAAEELDEPEVEVTGSRARKVAWTTSARYDFERRRGYELADSTAFAGPPISFRSRMRAKVGEHTTLLLVTDHDAGEGIDTPRRLFDFAAAAITISDVGPIREAVAGAIRPRFGLGLSMWSGQRMTRLASSASSFLRTKGYVRASGSAYENGNLQGIGLDLGLITSLRLIGYAARMEHDANVVDSGRITSTPTSGLHRNEREVDADDRLVGRIAGGGVLYDVRRFSAGVFAGASKTNLSISSGDRSYQMHRFKGAHWRGGSAFVSAEIGHGLRIAGEAALDDDGTPAVMAITRIATTAGLDLFCIWRHYPPSFNSVYGAPPGAGSSGTGNENGWSIAVNARAGRHRLTVYRDLYRKPWFQFDSYRPSIFSAWGFHADGRYADMRVTIRHDARLANREPAHDSPAAAPFSHRTRTRLRLGFDGDRRLAPTLDYVYVRVRDLETQSGHGLGQRLVWQPNQTLALTVGVVFFDSESGASGIYLYEPDLPDYLSVPLLSGSGQRTYAIIRLSLSRSITVWVKGGATRYAAERTIGSGVDRMTTSQVRQVSFAMRFSV